MVKIPYRLSRAKRTLAEIAVAEQRRLISGDSLQTMKASALFTVATRRMIS